MKTIKHFLLFLIILGTIASGCSKDNEPENSIIPLENSTEEEPQPGVTYVLGKRTKVISDEWEKLITDDVVWNYYSAEQGNVSFHVTQEAQLPQVGEILLKPKMTGKFPLGFMGRVIEVNKGEIVTQRVAPTEVFEELEIHIDTRETRGLKKGVTKSTTPPPPLPGPSPDIPIESYTSLKVNKEWAIETSVPFKKKGNTEISAGLTGEVTIDGFAIFDYSAVGSRTKEKYAIGVDITVSGEIGAKAEGDIIANIKSAELHWEGWTALGGFIPVLLEYEGSPALILKGNLSGKFTVSATKHITVGQERDSFTGDGEWHALEFPKEEDNLDWGIELEAEGLVGFGIMNDFRATVLGVIGPFVKCYAYPALRGKLSCDVVKALSGDSYNALRGNKLEFLLVGCSAIGPVVQVPTTDFREEWDFLSYEISKTLWEEPFLPDILPSFAGGDGTGTDEKSIWYVSKENTFFSGKYGMILYDKENKQKEKRYVSESPTKEAFSKTLVPFNPVPEAGYYTCPFYELWGITYVDKGQKLVFGTKPVDDEGLTEDIHNIIPDEYINALKNLGLKIYGGNTPPFIEGSYLTSPMKIVKSNFFEWGTATYDDELTFYNQNVNNLTIQMDSHMFNKKGFVDNNDSTSEGIGSFIVGHDNVFSIFMEEVTHDIYGHTVKTVNVLSGELADDGIKNYQNAMIMVDDHGDPRNIYIENGQGRLWKDGDGFSVKIQKLKTSRSSKTESSSVAKLLQFVQKKP